MSLVFQFWRPFGAVFKGFMVQKCGKIQNKNENFFSLVKLMKCQHSKKTENVASLCIQHLFYSFFLEVALNNKCLKRALIAEKMNRLDWNKNLLGICLMNYYPGTFFCTILISIHLKATKINLQKRPKINSFNE